MRAISFVALAVALCSFQLPGATFGTVVVIGGSASDLALDNQRSQLYIANFTGRRIDVMSTTDNTLRTPIPMTTQGESGSIALSPDSRYLLVANYADCTTAGGCAFLSGSTTPYLTIIDLVANAQTVLAIPQPSPPAASPSVPLFVAFGKGTQALLVTTTALYLVDPVAATLQPVPDPQVTLTSTPLSTTFGTFPPQIVQASGAVSGDGQTILVLAQGGQSQGATQTTPASPSIQVLMRYYIPSGTITATSITTSPALGPRVVSANLDGFNFLAGWSLFSANLAGWGLFNGPIVLLAEFPYTTGALNLGGLAWDYSRNVIYAQIPSGGPSDPPVLHIVDTDNLTVRERIQLPENLGGRAIFSSDMNTLYAISNSGVTVLPVGSFAAAHRVSTQEEQLLFQSNNCVSGPVTQTLDVVDLGGGSTDFTLSLPSGTQGITFSQVSGVTPAQVTVTVDPTVFQGLTGTTAVPLTIQSNSSIGIPNAVPLLINTKDPDQRGIIHSLPGTIVDLAADQGRGRIYALRQDRNQVIVMDGASFSPIAVLRTGNTPTKMAFTRDNNYLLVANDNSQIANVFDLNALQPTPPIIFPAGHYPRSIAVSNSTMFAVARTVGATPGQIDQILFGSRAALTPNSLGIYANCLPADSVMTASPSRNSIFTAMSTSPSGCPSTGAGTSSSASTSGGVLLLWDDIYSAFEASDQYSTPLGGAYAAVSDDLFLAGGMLFNRSMAPIGPLNGATATSSVWMSGTNALTVSADSPAAAGLVQRVSTLSAAIRPVPSIEAPVTKAILTTPPVGQIGQTILSFLQTMALTNTGSVLYLSISGFTELPANFDQPVAIPSIASLGNLADGGAVAPGSLVSITGSGFSTAAAAGESLPAPTTFGGICVTVNGIALPIMQVSPNEIDAQMPYEVAGAANLTVITPGGRSAPFSFVAPATAVAVFLNGQAGDFSGLPQIYRAANNQLVDFTNPIHPGDTLMIYATGLGQTSPPAITGAAAPSDPLESAIAVPSISLEGTALMVIFAGLVPGFVGLYQINAAVPHSIKSGAQTTLQIQQSTFTVRVVSP